MEITSGTCEHRWRYFVHLASRSVRARQCEDCGQRAVVAAQDVARTQLAMAEKLTA